MIRVEFCNDIEPKQFLVESNLYVEDIVKIICKSIKILPICQSLYSLRNSKTKLWPSLYRKLTELSTTVPYQFRIRFRRSSFDKLKEIDYVSYVYLFYQVRCDFLAGLIPNLEKRPEDSLGLVVTDILHHLISNPGKKVSDLEIKNFFPKCFNTTTKRINVKRRIEELYKSLSERFSSLGCDYIRDQYLETVDVIGRPGAFECYSVDLDEGGRYSKVEIFIDPFHNEHPGIYYETTKKVVHHMCQIEELVFVSVRKQDLTAEVCRENGIPCYVSFSCDDHLESFVGCLSGYYRLMKTWTFDLCMELPTPSLLYLRSNKCHGPVGDEFVKKKLKAKGGIEEGVAILRESSKEYDVYKLSIINLPQIELTILQANNKVYFENSDVMHSSLSELVKWAIATKYKDLGLKRLIPPSDLDKATELLICAEDKVLEPTYQQVRGPRILNTGNFLVQNMEPLRGRFADVYHVICPGEGNEDLAVKVPKLRLYEKEDFFKAMNKFLFIEGDCVVKVFGITLSPLTLVMEYLPLGPLDKYLQTHCKDMLQIDLVEAASYIAKALWDLHSKRMTHYNIRCHNVLVFEHTSQRFKVKLGDPGKVEYSLKDIHWLPREHLLLPSSALADPNVDTWAFATTLWQIFSLGAIPLPDADLEELRALYLKGFMLPRPEACPKDLYLIIRSCWHPDPHSRKNPQAIMRDIKQIFYYIFNSRRESQYQKPYADVIEPKKDDNSSDLFGDQLSISTQVTTLTQMDGSVAEVTLDQIMNYPLIPMDAAVADVIPVESSPLPTKEFQQMEFAQQNYPAIHSSSEISRRWSEHNKITLPFIHLQRFPEDGVSTTKLPCHSFIFRDFQKMETAVTLQELLEPPIGYLNDDGNCSCSSLMLNNCSIEILKPIGKGNYGYVFQGKMTYLDNRMEYVALKRLQSVGNTSDFKKEMDIMKNLRHENIVFMHGLIESDLEGSHLQYMVMEYLSLGSLQDYILSNKDDEQLTSDEKLLSFALDIANGMDYLESQQIIHRDLAARNVLVSSEDHVKITDFGLAQRPNQGNYYIVRTVREMPIRWYAIESIEMGKFSHKSDVWSYGVTLWEMFTRGLMPDLPNDGCHLIQALKNGTRLVCKAPCKPFIYSKLIRPCWDEDPSLRPDFARLVSTISELQEEIG